MSKANVQCQMQEVGCSEAESEGVEVRVVDHNQGFCRMVQYLMLCGERFGTVTVAKAQLGCARKWAILNTSSVMT